MTSPVEELASARAPFTVDAAGATDRASTGVVDAVDLFAIADPNAETGGSAAGGAAATLAPSCSGCGWSRNEKAAASLALAPARFFSTPFTANVSAGMPPLAGAPNVTLPVTLLLSAIGLDAGAISPNVATLSLSEESALPPAPPIANAPPTDDSFGVLLNRAGAPSLGFKSGFIFDCSNNPTGTRGDSSAGSTLTRPTRRATWLARASVTSFDAADLCAGARACALSGRSNSAVGSASLNLCMALRS